MHLKIWIEIRNFRTLKKRCPRPEEIVIQNSELVDSVILELGNYREIKPQNQ